MKAKNRLLALGSLAGAALYFGLAAQSVTAATIVGTKHDLSGKGWGSDQVCIFCHAPHNTPVPQTGPLWNHAMTAATFQMYTSNSLNATGLAVGGVSKLCMSCHDGTVALDSYGSRTGTNMITGGALLGTDLRNDHPIGFTYDAALATADGGLVTPSDASWVNNTEKKIPLYAAKLECASCHGVHDTTNSPFLRVSNSGSALCLKCHVK